MMVGGGEGVMVRDGEGVMDGALVRTAPTLIQHW